MARFNVDDYVSVQERINKFWHECPDGRITTEVIPVGDFHHCVVLANVYRSQTGGPDATGIAAEERAPAGSRVANESSWWENCETSAIGRALANMGYAVSGKDRMSREEAEKVNRYDEMTPEPPERRAPASPMAQPNFYQEQRQSGGDANLATDRQREAIHRMAGKLGWDDIEVEEELKKPLSEATRQDASAFITYLGSLLDQERTS